MSCEISIDYRVAPSTLSVRAQTRNNVAAEAIELK